jgi:hypothetical protein
LLINLLSITSDAQRRKIEAAIPIQVSNTDYIAPQIQEIKGYFITVCLGLLAFLAKEIYSWARNRNSTLAEDLIELKKNDMILMNKIDMILSELKHKPDREEVLKEILRYNVRDRNEK